MATGAGSNMQSHSPLFKMRTMQHLEYCIQAWAPYLKKDVVSLGSVQRPATRLVEGQKGKSHTE